MGHPEPSWKCAVPAQHYLSVWPAVFLWLLESSTLLGRLGGLFWSGGRPVLSAPGRVALAPSLFRGLGASSPGFVFFRTHWAKACCSLHAAWINVAWSLLVLTLRKRFWSAGVKHNWFSGLLNNRSCWRTRITTWEYIGILRNTGNTGEYLGILWNT